MREIDDLVVGTFGVTLVQMLENAGRSLAQFVLDRYRPRTVTVLVGSGHNGGGGLVAARHLANRGVEVTVVLSRAADLAQATSRQLNVARAIGITVIDEPRDASVVVDALIGYSLQGPVTGPSAQLIELANAQPAPVVALDVPSGLDATSGCSDGACVRAAATLTLALPKTGLVDASSHTGELFLADISIPRYAYQIMRLDVPEIFTTSPVVHLVGASN